MKVSRLGFTVACALGSAAYATQVQAGAATEYSVIVLDQTGSMNQPSTVNNTPSSGAPVGTQTMFDSAITAASNWVSVDSQTPGTRRAYAIYTFKDDRCCEGSQSGLFKIWPKDPPTVTVGCDPAVDGAQTEAETRFCLFNETSSTTPYESLIAILDSLRTYQVVGGNVMGGDTYNLLSTPALDPGQNKGGAVFKPAYGLGPNTPLANALCDAADRLKYATGTKYLTFTLETDGNENYSAYQLFKACSGETGGLAAGATTFPKATSNWGLPATSWQGNVMRRMVRLVSTPPLGDNPTVNNPTDITAIARGNIIPTGTTGAEDVPVLSKWRIDVHYSICDPTYPLSPLPCTPTTPAAAVAAPLMVMQSLLSSEQAVLSPVPVVKSAKTTTAGATTLAAAATTAAATPGRTQSISATELSFFSALGKVNPKSSFRTFVRDPVTAPTCHKSKIAGDVDDSGCTDGADFRIVTQKDVYLQKAVLPNQLAIRADLSCDQWVTKADALMVLANWGKGCINPPGPKPKLKY